MKIVKTVIDGALYRAKSTRGDQVYILYEPSNFEYDRKSKINFRE